MPKEIKELDKAETKGALEKEHEREDRGIDAPSRTAQGGCNHRVPEVGEGRQNTLGQQGNEEPADKQCKIQKEERRRWCDEESTE